MSKTTADNRVDCSIARIRALDSCRVITLIDTRCFSELELLELYGKVYEFCPYPLHITMGKINEFIESCLKSDDCSK